MTRYEVGFMNKCAEYGVSMRGALNLLTKTAVAGDYEATVGQEWLDDMAKRRAAYAKWRNDSKIQAGKDIYRHGVWRLPSEQSAVDAYLQDLAAKRRAGAAATSQARARRRAIEEQEGATTSAPAAAPAPAQSAVPTPQVPSAPVATAAPAAARPAPRISAADKRLADLNKKREMYRSLYSDEGVKLDEEGLQDMHSNLAAMSDERHRARMADSERLMAFGDRMHSIMDGGAPAGQTAVAGSAAPQSPIARNSFAAGGGIPAMADAAAARRRAPRTAARPATRRTPIYSLPGDDTMAPAYTSPILARTMAHPYNAHGLPQAPATRWNTAGKKGWFNRLTNEERIDQLKLHGMTVREWNRMSPYERGLLTKKWGGQIALGPRMPAVRAEPTPPVMADVAPPPRGRKPYTRPRAPGAGSRSAG